MAENEPTLTPAVEPKTGEVTAQPRQVFKDNQTGAYYLFDPANPHFMTKIKTVQQMMELNLEKTVAELVGNRQIDPANMPEGLGTTDRLMMKNFITDPNVAKAILRSKGFMVVSFGKGWNFGVKPKDRLDQPFRYIDPTKVGAREAILDTLDLLYDTGQAAASTAVSTALSASPAASVIAGAGTAMGTEALRNRIGSAYFKTDVPDNPATMLGAMAGGGVFTPGMGKLITGTGRFAGELGGEVGAMLTRAQPTGTLSARDVFSGRVLSGVKAKEKMPSMATAARDFMESIWSVLPKPKKGRMTEEETRAHLADWSEKRIKELGRADEIIEQFKDEPVDLTPYLDDLAKFTQPEQEMSAEVYSEVTRQATGDVPAAAAKLLDNAYGVLLRYNVQDPARTPAYIAKELVRWAQARTKSVGGLGDKEKEKVIIQLHEQFQGGINDALKGSVDDAMVREGIGGPSYSALMAEGRKKYSQLLNFLDKTGADMYKRDPEKAEEKAISYMLNLHGHRKSSVYNALKDFEANSNVALEDIIKPAVIGTRIGDEGAMGILPRITATGGIPLVAEQGAGLLQAAVGLSPRNIIRAGQAVSLMSGSAPFKPVGMAQSIMGAMGRGLIKPLSTGTQATLSQMPARAVGSQAIIGLLKRLSQPSTEPEAAPGQEAPDVVPR